MLLWMPLLPFILILLVFSSCVQLSFLAKYEQSTFEYVTIPKEELRSWYTESDLCVLTKESGDPLTNFKSCRKKGDQPIRMCGSTHGGVGLGGPKRNCNPPSSFRTFFFKYLKGYGPSLRPVADLIETLRNKTSLVFLGDSLMYQMADAFVCEAFRENRKKGAKVIGNRFLALYAPSKLLLSIDEEIENIDISIYFIRLNSIGSRSDFISNIWNPSIVRILNESSSVLLITNIGLYYHEQKLYEKELLEYIEFLHEQVRLLNGQLSVFFRETSAQHWSDGNGYYDKLRNSTSNSRHRGGSDQFIPLNCLQLQEEEVKRTDWKNSILRDVLARSRYDDTIHYLKGFMDITTPLFNMHNEVVNTTDIGAMDCTHYCYFPSMWMPMFTQLLDVIRKQKGLKSETKNTS